MSATITLNPKYTLKPNNDQAILLSTDSYDFDNIFVIIHPVHAMILSCVNGREMDITVEDISCKLQVESKFVRSFILLLIENKKTVPVELNGTVVYFPPMVILNSDEKPYRIYEMDDFDYDSVDLNYKRLISPARFTLMVNNVCKTNCYYCYADRRSPMQSKLDFKRVQDLIKEAYDNHIVSIDTIGGEFFLYPYWKELIIEMQRYNYHTMVSTKIPIESDTISFLKQHKITFLQISLDTMIKENLMKILRVRDDYYDKMKNTFKLLEEAGIAICVHTILNRYNDSLEDMISLFDFLSRFRNIRYWRCDMVGESLYNATPIEDMLPRTANQSQISSYLSQLKEIAAFDIYPIETPTEKAVPDKEKYDKFMSRGFCTGNFSAVFILPDGNVTICEELYWNPHFIIGCLTKHSLIEIWNSDLAKNIYCVDQKSIAADSVCSSCNVFNECRSFRQVCYKKILKKFGTDKWYYPDPDCPFIADPVLS